MRPIPVVLGVPKKEQKGVRPRGFYAILNTKVFLDMQFEKEVFFRVTLSVSPASLPPLLFSLADVMGMPPRPPVGF